MNILPDNGIMKGKEECTNLLKLKVDEKLLL